MSGLLLILALSFGLSPVQGPTKLVSQPSYEPFVPLAADSIDFWVIIGDGGSSDSIFGLQPSPNPNNYYLGVTVGEPCNQISYDGSGSYAGYFGFWWPFLRPLYEGVEEEPGAGSQRFITFLGPPSPNPSKGRVTIQYGVADERDVSLAVYDLSGRLVKNLARGKPGPGNYTVIWTGESETGTRVAQGLYILRYEAGDYKKVEKLLMVR
ncbi:MAG: T9SS type A sorting domain-containing protein [candidate division WOR-3 bacterium]